MRILKALATALALFTLAGTGAVTAAESAQVQPNILLIVADDMGYTDLGSFGGEIHTPNLNRLAEQGLRLTNFHTLPTCAPTRAVLLTGTDNHIAGLGSQLNSAKQQGQPGYEGHLNNRVVTAAEILGASGYRTYMAGKWHLGHEVSQRPAKRGFQETFALLPGGAGHFAEPVALHPAEPVEYSRNGKTLGTLPEDFYSTRAYTEHLMAWLERDANSQSPFFAYLAYTAPHDPLHAPQAYIDKYKGHYDAGYEVLREQRFIALKVSGVLPESVALPVWPRIIPRWASLSAEEKALSSRNMEIYAAMIDYMDEQIGRVFELLRQQGQLDNTLVVFMSDNGPNGLPSTTYPTHDAEYHAQFDNRLQNVGRPSSFPSLAAGWATASSAALSKFKGFITEGGIRTPAIVKPPSVQPAASINSDYVHVADWLPTFLDLAGVHHPSTTDDSIAALRGSSLAPFLRGKTTKLNGSKSRAFEVHGSRAIFKGKWKATQAPPPFSSGEWKLFNIHNDPSESINLAHKEPENLAELIAEHEVYEKEVGVVYDALPIVKPIHDALKILQWLIVAAIFWSMFLQRHHMSPARIGYSLLQIVCLVGLFSAYFNIAGWALIAGLLTEVLILMRKPACASKVCLSLVSCTVLLLILIIKSGYLLIFSL